MDPETYYEIAHKSLDEAVIKPLAKRGLDPPSHFKFNKNCEGLKLEGEGGLEEWLRREEKLPNRL